MNRQFASIILLVLAVGLFASACATKKELLSEDTVLADRANNLYAKGRFSQSTEKYRKLTQEHPDSPYRRMSMLGLADSLYKDKQYFEALLYYERFIELYPLDPLTPRAQFYLAMSYYHDTTTADRDQSNTIKAVDSFDLFLKKYPTHALADSAHESKDEMRALLADSKLDIARFYYRINRNQSAIIRLKEFLASYPGYSAEPEAMYLLAKCYYAEQAYKKAALTLTELVKKHPGNEYSVQGAELANALGIIKGASD